MFKILALLMLAQLAACHKEKTPDEPPHNDSYEPASTIDIGGKHYDVDSVTVTLDRPGLWYVRARIMDGSFPLIIHCIRMDRQTSGLTVEAWTGKDSLRAVERPSNMVARKSSADKEYVAAINGDFFNMSGEAIGETIGGEVIDGIITRSPDANYPVIVFDKFNNPLIDYVGLNATVKDRTATEHVIDGINRIRWENQLILYTSHAGKHTHQNEWGVELLLAPNDGTWETLTNYQFVHTQVEKKSVYETESSMAIPAGKVVLSGNGTSRSYVENQRVGDGMVVSVALDFASKPSPKPEVESMVGGYNVVVKDSVPVALGQLTPDDKALLNSRHPRTAVGYSHNGRMLYFVIVEGRRTGVAAGVTTPELADVMRYLGAANAINLDGGGSSCMVLNGRIKNYTTDGNERPVANGLAIVKTK